MKPGLPRPGREATWHDLECGAYVADLPLWKAIAAERAAELDRPCRLLELGCGTGRVALALAEEGHDVEGLDRSRELVDSLRRRALARKAQVDVVVGDACSFELGERFDLVLAPMQLAQLLSARERRRMLACVVRHLGSGGRAAFALVSLDVASGEDPSAQLPDVQEIDGWVYSSQPRMVRLSETPPAADGAQPGGAAIALERVRQVVSPAGEVTESAWRTRLEPVLPETLEREARSAGLAPESRRLIPAADSYAPATVVNLRRADKQGRSGDPSS